VYDRTKRVSTLSVCDAGSVVKKGFSLCPFTLNYVLFIGSTIITAPCGKTVHTMNGPDQRVFSFPEKNMKPRVVQQNLVFRGKFFRFMI